MPEYAGFSTSLISQYDAATIPESFVRVVTTPTLRSFHLDNLCDSPGLTQHPDKTFSDLHKKATTVIETYIPVYQSSQFWICYECPPPGQDEDDEVRYYYFKLCYDGKCVLSWGVGEQEHWRGKTTFGLFDGGRDFEGKRIVEKRGLFYPSHSAQEAEGFEIRVFRAKARRREPVRYQSVLETTGGGGGSLDLTGIGKVKQGERSKLMYSYALLDAKDEPWITFRYRFETDEDVTPRMEGTLISTDLGDTTTASAEMQEDTDEAPEEVTESSLWSSLEQSTPPQQPSTAAPDVTTASRRLSFPPRVPLFSSTTHAEPSSPIKQHASASDDDLTRPIVRNSQYSSIAFAEGAFSCSRRTTGLRKPEWTAVRGASPSIDAEIEETTPAHRKTASGSSGLLKSVVASALRRREDKCR